ncbi:MAG: phosphate regulon sensor histidine kinase PhoR [Candidatus Competibacterales bacterium]|nr:phosphate regulon sensor histidine kinase PhoR [Candidatus Competibacterales bacterium]
MNSRLWQVIAGMLAIHAVMLVLGLVLGRPWLLLWIATLGCLGWQLLHFYWLERWLGSDLKAPPPQALDGYWRGVYYRILRLRRRSRKRKRKLSRTLHNFQQGVRALPDAVVVLDRGDHRVSWCNPAAERLLELDPQRDRGLLITSLVRHPDFIAYLDRPDEQGVRFAAPAGPDQRLRARLLPYTKKQDLLWVSDVSQSHRLEQVRRDFVANASHELRTPLTVISGYLETLQGSLEVERSPWHPPLTSMRQQVERMLAIVRDLLLLSRLESPDEPLRRLPVAVPALLEEIVADARSLSGERDHEIVLEADPVLWLSGAERELRSAFANLVVNAVVHTTPGTRIEVRWYRDEQGLHLAVEDEGEGIPAQHLPRLSERFYRVDRSRGRGRGGTGLGLAIVKHVLQRHGGQLRIDSIVGEGSRFICDFPSALRAAPPPPRLIDTGD